MNRSKSKEPLIITITPPNIQRCEVLIIGTGPLVMHRFAKKVQDSIVQHREEQPGRKQKTREVLDTDEAMERSTHRSVEGWIGIPASAFRAAGVRACSLLGIEMTLAKLCFFVAADGIDDDSAQPLVRLYGEPEKFITTGRIRGGGTTTPVRPLFRKWYARVRVEFDADRLKVVDVYNMFARIGIQVGILEGRHSSTSSSGQGWGTFRVGTDDDIKVLLAGGDVHA